MNTGDGACHPSKWEVCIKVRSVRVSTISVLHSSGILDHPIYCSIYAHVVFPPIVLLRNLSFPGYLELYLVSLSQLYLLSGPSIFLSIFIFPSFSLFISLISSLSCLSLCLSLLSSLSYSCLYSSLSLFIPLYLSLFLSLTLSLPPQLCIIIILPIYSSSNTPIAHCEEWALLNLHQLSGATDPIWVHYQIKLSPSTVHLWLASPW